MKKLRKNNMYREEGFSLIEVIIAITIAGMLIGFAFGIYLFGQRYILQWQNDLKLQNELHTIANGISEAIYAADRITGITSDKLSLEMANDSVKTYQVKDDMLFLNEKNILHSSVSLVDFSVRSQISRQQIANNQTDNIGKVTLLKLSLALTNRKDTIATERAVHLRRPSNWSNPKHKK